MTPSKFLKPILNRDKERSRLKPPNEETPMLLHSCCAPCSGDIMNELTRSGIQYTILFYNPNIHPKREYDLRKEENKKYANRLNVPFIDLDYDKDNWFKHTEGYENEPERGYRCTLCFDFRFERTASYAAANGFKVFSSTLGASRWKNIDQINNCGVRAAKQYDNLIYWTYNWRKGGGSNRMIEVSKTNAFYQQEYCGCVYSLRDTNKHRIKQCRNPIQIGVKINGNNS